VISARDVETIYEVPLGAFRRGDRRDHHEAPRPPYRRKSLKDWEDLVHKIQHPVDEVTIGIVGKYVSYEDSYKSLNEALSTAGWPRASRCG
jgi:CTP synthase